jgi:hypothetical protein
VVKLIERMKVRARLARRSAQAPSLEPPLLPIWFPPELHTERRRSTRPRRA